MVSDIPAGDGKIANSFNSVSHKSLSCKCFKTISCQIILFRNIFLFIFQMNNIHDFLKQRKITDKILIRFRKQIDYAAKFFVEVICSSFYF